MIFVGVEMIALYKEPAWDRAHRRYDPRIGHSASFDLFS
jgi:hypothetical protein